MTEAVKPLVYAPCGTNLLILRDLVRDMYGEGIIMKTDVAKNDYNPTGRVMAIGPGVNRDHFPASFQEGCFIKFDAFAADNLGDSEQPHLFLLDAENVKCVIV